MPDEKPQTVGFDAALPAQSRETDRAQLIKGLVIIIENINVSTKTKYGKVARIGATMLQDGDTTMRDADGVDKPVHLKKGEKVKLWTTSRTLITACEELQQRYGDFDGNLSPTIQAVVQEKRSENKRNYLIFASPST